MYISPLERMKKLHLWIGATTKSGEEWNRYFESENGLSQFSIDIGMEEYDEDFIGILPLFDHAIDIAAVLNEIPVDQNCIEDIIKTAHSLGTEKANAVFYLTDSSVKLMEPLKTHYNDCAYFGLYDSNLR